MLGEFSRNDVGYSSRSQHCFLIMKNETEEMMSYSSGSQTNFNNEKHKEMLRQISRNC